MTDSAPGSPPHPAIRTVPTATHWGAYLARTNGSRLLGLDPHPDDPQPSGIGGSVADALTSAGRLTVPLVRRGWLEYGPGPSNRPGSPRRGDDRYVEVSWNTAAALVAGEVDRVRIQHGNRAIFGGSFGRPFPSSAVADPSVPEHDRRLHPLGGQLFLRCDQRAAPPRGR